MLQSFRIFPSIKTFKRFERERKKFLSNFSDIIIIISLVIFNGWTEWNALKCIKIPLLKWHYLLYSTHIEQLYIHTNFFPPPSSLFSHHHRHVILGRRRLEICSIGIRSFIFMDIRHRLCAWHMPNYTPSANTLRHNQSDRYSTLEDCQEEAWTTKNGE